MKPFLILFFALFSVFEVNAQTCTDNLNSTYGTSYTSSISKSITSTKVYCSPNTLSGSGSNTLTFTIAPPSGNTITFDNLNLSNFDKVIFKVEGAAKIYLKNSTFTSINQVEFQFNQENDLYDSYTTEYFISGNKFQNQSNFGSIHKTLLSFKAIEGESIDHRLDNVNITDNEFYIGDTENEYAGDRVAIGMNRSTSNQDIRNITISDNVIIMKGQRVLAIDFAHNFKSHPSISNTNIGVGNPTNNYLPYNNFDMTQNSLYTTNKNIYINNNTIIAESTNPHYGIMLQGPYDNVDIKYNSVIGFGLVSIQDGYYRPEGIIDLYGSRNNGEAGESTGKSYYYSNNLKNVEISYNHIEGPANGIRISGGNNITIHKNSIEILDWPTGLQSANEERVAGIVVGGGYTWGPPELGTDNVSITYNSINLNNLSSKTGIGIQHTKNFDVQNNIIDNLKSVGIYYYSDSPYNQNTSNIANGIGISTIISNTLDYEDNSSSQNYINASAWGISVLDNHGISLFRHDLSYPTNEDLEIYNNIIETEYKSSYESSNYDQVHTAWYNSVNPWYNKVSSSNGDPITVNSKTETSSPIKHIATGDFDGDGFDEYVIRNNDNEYFVIFTNTSTNPDYDIQHWSPIPIFWGDSNYESKLKAGDINGDGKDDLVFLNKNNSGQFKIRVALSTGGSFQQFTGLDFSTSFNSSSYLSMAIGNFDDDNADEIAIRTRANGFYILNLNGANLSMNSVWSDPNISVDSWYEPTMHSGDFNEDGYDDLFFLRRNNDGYWMVRVMTYDPYNDGFDGKAGYNQTDMNNTFLSTYSHLASAVGDYDGDGDADMMIRKPNDAYYVLKSNGTNSFYVKQLWKQGYMMWGDSQYPVRILSGKINGDDGNNEYMRDDLFMWSQANDNNSSAPGYFVLRTAQSKTNNTFNRFNNWELKFKSDGDAILETPEYALLPSKIIGIDNENEANEIPNEFSLSQNYPNPFNPTTTISYSIPIESKVKLTVFDLTGREIKTLVNKTQSQGRYSVRFDASSLGSGVYLYRLNTPSFTQTKKFTLIK